MLIHNYGLFWRRRDVFWGKQGAGNEGRLWGRRAKALTEKPVDFSEQRGVYALYDDAFHLVYIGQAGANDSQRLLSRLRQHTRDALADRWMRFSWFGVNWVKSTGKLAADASGATPKVAEILNHIEAILISAAEPAHNRQGGRFGDEVQQFLQWRDESALDPTQEDMIRQIWNNRNSN